MVGGEGADLGRVEVEEGKLGADELVREKFRLDGTTIERAELVDVLLCSGKVPQG